MTRSTPEGARDYLVPSRIHEQKFYALPQSPQLFKQLLMVSGMDRYFQIVKCYRDEDLRPNRQPEFTQLDLEASFVDEAFIYELIETLLEKLFKMQGIDMKRPFPKITYDEAMDKYGSDHPDLRFGLEMKSVTDLLKNTGYKIFNSIASQGGTIKGINLKGQSEKLTKNVLQEEFAKKVIPQMGGKGMSWFRVEEGTLKSNIVQFFSEEEIAELIQRMEAEDGDVLIFVADTNLDKVNDLLGRFRVFIADYLGLIDKSKFEPCWVVDFPLFDISDGKLTSVHHPFTRPQTDISKIQSKEELLKVKAAAYDVVINGEEIGGGSLRIFDKKQQSQIFSTLGLNDSEIQEKFGFFIDAFNYGMPPHGGIALGLDRLLAMLCKTSSIREVIAFPKNRVAVCPMTQAPAIVENNQLKELKIQAYKDLS